MRYTAGQKVEQSILHPRHGSSHISFHSSSYNRPSYRCTEQNRGVKHHSFIFVIWIWWNLCQCHHLCITTREVFLTAAQIPVWSCKLLNLDLQHTVTREELFNRKRIHKVYIMYYLLFLVLILFKIWEIAPRLIYCNLNNEWFTALFYSHTIKHKIQQKGNTAPVKSELCQSAIFW